MKRFTLAIIGIYAGVILFSVVYATFFMDTIQAARSGNVSRLQHNLDNKKNTDTKLLEKAAMQAIKNNRVESLNLILAKMDSDAAKNLPDAHVMEAISDQRLDILRMLIEKGMKIEGKNGTDFLSYAISSENFDAAFVLMENGADPKTLNPEIFSLDSGVKSSDMHDKKVKFLKFIYNHGVDMKGAFGKNAVYFGVNTKDYDFVSYLINRGALAHIGTALYYAACNNEVKMIEFLLSKGVNLQSNYGFDAVRNAAHLHNREALEYLLKFGAPVRIYNNKRKTSEDVLMDAIQAKNDAQTIKLILEKGNYKQKEYQKTIDEALSYAVETCDSKIVKLILVVGAVPVRKSEKESDVFKQLASVKENKVEWFDFDRKQECDRILELLEKYEKK